MKMKMVTASLVAVVMVALAGLSGGAAFVPSAANAQDPGTTAYKVEMTRINGDRSSVAGVQAADKVQVNPGNACDDITVTVAADSADSVILAAADAKSSCHSITTGSRYIDADGDVHNFHSGKRTYWLIVKQVTTPPDPTSTPAPPTPTPAPTSTPGPTADYTVTHVRVDGPRDSAQAVKEANKTAAGISSGHHEFTLAADATTAEILAAADALSTHSITTGSRYIDASGEVHNFQSGKRTYWLITKSEVNVAAPTPTPEPQNVGANQLTLTGTIADQVLTKGVSYTSAVAFPAATGIDGTVTYSVASQPSGITMDSTTRKLTGTATAAQAETTLTYTATDSDTDTATLTFKLTVLDPGDYDDDNDGLIEVANLAQLNAIRWDLDGDGATASGSDTTNYAAAFPSALSGMGCKDDEANDSDKVCGGYELTAYLNFDSDNDGDVDINDNSGLYWNSGAGWYPIGDRSAAFTAKFDGNTYAIYNLYVNNSSTSGLFGRIIGKDSGVAEAKGEIFGLSLTGGEVIGGASAGALVAENYGGVINYCTSDVEVTGKYWVGGLVGENWGSIKNSFATGAVAHTTSWGYAGGLVGRNIFDDSSIENTFAEGAVTGASTVRMGGLVGQNSSAEIKNSYSTGTVDPGSNTGGMVGSHAGFGNAKITGSYWDTDTSGRSDSAGGTGKTTTELQTPTSDTGIYTDWDADRWSFGTATEYPRL